MAVFIEWFENIESQQLREAWETIEKQASLRVFQRYDWNRMMAKQYEHRSLFGKLHEGKVFVGLVREDNQPVMIAPLVKIGEGVYFLGWDSWSDYLDFIYGDNLSQEVFDGLMDAVKEKFSFHYFALHCIRKESRTCQWMEAYLERRAQIYPTVKRDESGCVWIRLPESFEEYHKSLSKSTRQNLRTARNRLATDGLEGTLAIYPFGSIPDSIIRETQEVYRKRRIAAEEDQKSRLKKQLKKLVGQVDHTIEEAMRSIAGGMVLTFEIGKPGEKKQIGAFCYAVEWEKGMFGLQVAVNMDFAKYSPGMLLFLDYIQESYQGDRLEWIDLTRGQEEYKYKLGGERHDLCYYRLFAEVEAE